MRNAERVLNIHRNRGSRGLPLERVYRHLFNPEFYLRAYAKIYRNAGAMTKGTTNETVDGMSLARIERIIELVRAERYRWKPVRRTHIPKRNGGSRLLGIPTWSDKLLQEVLRTLLARGILRPPFPRLVTRLPSGTWLPHGLGGHPEVAGRHLVHRG